MVMKRIRRVARAAIVAAAVMFVFAPLAARAQVLDQVPSDALVVIKFNKLKATSEKWGKMAQKLGIAEDKPALADPLKSFKENAQITNGLDENGDAAMVIPNQKLETVENNAAAAPEGAAEPGGAAAQ